MITAPEIERTATHNGVSIAYDTIGNADDAPLLLIHGLGVQLIGWDLDFCQKMVERGYFVIRFDNRDVGHSSRLTEFGVPDLTQYMGSMIGQSTPPPPYTLSEMATDAVAVLDDLDIDTAHVLGVSMGGMIAQMVAINHPDRVRTLTSIMSTTGRPLVSIPEQEAMELLMAPPATTLEQHIEMSLKGAKLLHGPRFPVNEERTRQMSRATWQRGISPDGTVRQLAAVLGSGSRHEVLATIRMPTLVIHGDADRLVKLAGGQDTANVVPNARLHVMEGVGHAIPEELWDEICDLVMSHAR